MKYFITGMHRAGTHATAKHFAGKHSVSWSDEGRIRGDSFAAVKMMVEGYSPKWELQGRTWLLKPIRDKSLDKGFILQCPGLAHKTIELSMLGKVIWPTRENKRNLVASMSAALPHDMFWHITKQFKDEFPDDQIWDRLSYSDPNDAVNNFVRYCSIVVGLKTYFYEKYFKGVAEKYVLEDVPGYQDRARPLSPNRERIVMEELRKNESICLY